MYEGKIRQNKINSYIVCKIMITLQLKNLWEIPTALGACTAHMTDFLHKIL